MKILNFSAKCSDCFGFDVIDDNKVIIDMDQGYVPYDMGIGGGDYIEMEIDIETGKIIGWDKEVVNITLHEFIEEKREENEDFPED